jgi:hypothetical protein
MIQELLRFGSRVEHCDSSSNSAVERARRMATPKYGGRLATTIVVAVATLASFSASQPGGTPEQRKACGHDAMRLCSSEIPDVPAITACMVRNVNRLSPACRTQFR